MLNNLNEKLQTAYEYGNWTDVIKEADAKLDEELAKGKEEAKWGKITGTLADQTDLKTALDDKLDKVTSETTKAQVYSKGTDGTNSMLDCSANADASTVMVRDANGNTKVGTPQDDADATPKKYVEDGLATKSAVSGTDDGTNWTGLTIDGVTKGIGGSSTHRYLHDVGLYYSPLSSSGGGWFTDAPAFGGRLLIINETNEAFTKPTLKDYFDSEWTSTESIGVWLINGASFSGILQNLSIGSKTSNGFLVHLIYQNPTDGTTARLQKTNATAQNLGAMFSTDRVMQVS